MQEGLGVVARDDPEATTANGEQWLNVFMAELNKKALPYEDVALCQNAQE